MLLLPPRSTLFPYTTLFRSSLSASGLPPYICASATQSFSAPNSSRSSRTARQAGSFRPRSSSVRTGRSEEHTSELQSRLHLVCRLLLEKKNKEQITSTLTAL